MSDNNWKNPDWDLAINNTSSPRNDITTFATQELLDELVKRDGVIQEHIPRKESVRMSFTGRELAHWFDGEATILVIKK